MALYYAGCTMKTILYFAFSIEPTNDLDSDKLVFD